jgi:Flp pilus assembly protein TadG
MRSLRGDDGMVTAELACALPVLAVLVAVALSAVTVAGQAVRAQDAARELARAAARGDPAAGRALAAQLAPSAISSVTSAGGAGGGEVSASVQIVVHPLGHWLPAVTVHGQAVAAMEPTGSGASTVGTGAVP